MKIQSLYRYPVKGLQGELLNQVSVSRDAPLPYDRCFALTHGRSDITAGAPKWALKDEFHMLMHKGDEHMAELRPQFDEDINELSIYRAGDNIFRENVGSPAGIRAIENFFFQYLRADSRMGTPRFVQSDSVWFGNLEEPVISLINLESVKDIARVSGQEVDAARFRGNIIVEGGKAWEERDWVGKSVNINGVTFEVLEETIRCGATVVNPNTCERDMNIPKILNKNFGHLFCGVYLIAKDNGMITTGDTVSVE